MKVLRLFFCLLGLFFLSAPAWAVTTLWTKVLTLEPRYSDMVGSDGTVVIVDGYSSSEDVRKIYWIDRSGTALAELVPPSSDFPHQPHYVSRDELMLGGRGMALYHLSHEHLPVFRL